MELTKDLFGRRLKDNFLDTDKSKRYFDSVDLSTDLRDVALVVNGIKHVLETNQKFNYNKQLFECSPDAFYGDVISQTSLKKGFVQNRTATGNNYDNIYGLFNNHLVEELNDTIISYKYPGYGSLLKERKEILFGNKDIETTSDYVEFVDLLLKLLRFPTKINEESYNKFKEDIEYIQNYVTTEYNCLPTSINDINKISGVIADVAQKYYIKEEEEQEEQNKGLDELFDKYDKTDSTPVTKEDEEFTKKLEEEINNINYEKEGETLDGLIHFEYVTNTDSSFYKRITEKFNLSKASSLSRILARKNRDYQFTLKSMRSGRLDTNKLAEAKQKVPTIYERIGEVHTDKLCIGILIDMSGSMSGAKIEKARETMIYLYELLKNNKDIELFIYGHTADYQSKFANIFIFKEGKHFDKYSLSKANAIANNKDGYAIHAVTKRMRKLTNKKGILFVISDGQPAGNKYSGQMAIKHTRDMVIASQKLGFQIIQIAIQGNVHSKEMFDYYINMTNIETLPTQLVTYVSKYIDKEVKTKMTL